MSFEKLKTVGKDTVVPIQLTLLIALVVGIYGLTRRVTEWENQLDSFDQRLASFDTKLGYRWTYLMERDAWTMFEKLNPELKIPDVKEIRDEILDSSDQ